MGMGRVNEVFPNGNHWVISSKQRNKTVHKLHSKTVNSLRTRAGLFFFVSPCALWDVR